MRKKKDYEIGLSYTHKDMEIADIVGIELENIFADGLFMDELRAEANSRKIAYKLGQAYGDLGQASGNRNLVLVSSNRTQNIEFALNRSVHYKQIDDFCKEYEGNNRENDKMQDWKQL